MALEDVLQKLGEGLERVRERPLKDYFLPTSTPSDFERKALSSLGTLLQRAPETKVNIPAPKGFEPLPLKATRKSVEFLTSLPGEMIRSYGRSADKIGKGEKLGFEDYLNMSDFIPGIGFIGIGGLKPVVRKAGQELIEKAGKEVVEKAGKRVVEEVGEKVGKTLTQKAAKEGALQRLRHLFTYNDELKRTYNLSDAEIAKIDFKEAKNIFETLPTQLRDVVRGRGRTLAEWEKAAPIPNQELSYLFQKPGVDVKKKVNILNYLGTPEKVLDKIGLTKEKAVLRQGWDGYQRQLREELIRISDWQKRVPRKDSNQAIFDYLDGKIEGSTLNPEELKVAGEVKTYLKGWADKLGLPEEKQITNYITHLFERTNEGVEFPLEIAKKIKDKTAGSVYDPFLMKRTGQEDYIRNTWRALEAYVKRGTRKVNLDPALEMLSKAADSFEPATEAYIKRYSHQINLRPTEVDNLLDNLLKQSPIGYKFTQRPTAYLTNKWRQTVYRGALGLNLGSALRNLSQGANTYAVLGEKYTTLGYVDTIIHLIRNDFDELAKYGVLSDNIVIDRELHATKILMDKVDDGLFVFFDFSEKVNRASAYFGAKRQAIAKGLPIPEAIDYAKGIVRKTQFTFGQIDQPVGIGSDLAKTFTQFLNFPIKQVEFLGGLIKDKNFAGILRYIAGSLVYYATLGKLFGMDLKEFIPFNDMRFASPASEALGIRNILSSDERKKEEGQKALLKTIPLLFPAGVQLKKSLQGLISGARGYTATPTGRARYPVGGTLPKDLQLLLFGQYAPQEAKEYYGKNRSPLGEKQTEEFERKGLPYYERIMREREE